MRELKKLILSILNEYSFGDNLKNGDYVTGVKKMYFMPVADEIIKRSALIKAAPQMLEALQNLENDANQIPDHAWRLVQDAIELATPDLNIKIYRMSRE